MDVVILNSLGHLYLLQVIVNWKPLVEQEIMPYPSGFEKVVHQSNFFIIFWMIVMQRWKLGTRMILVCTQPGQLQIHLSSFRMDNDIQQKDVNLSPKATGKDERIIKLVVCLKIGLDRLFSRSSATHDTTKWVWDGHCPSKEAFWRRIRWKNWCSCAACSTLWHDVSMTWRTCSNRLKIKSTLSKLPILYSMIGSALQRNWFVAGKEGFIGGSWHKEWRKSASCLGKIHPKLRVWSNWRAA